METGVKWAPKQSLTITAALYRLDRTNTRATDPNDATRIIQTGAARANGLEIGATGQLNRFWSIAGGYANQKAFVVSDTTAARAGALIALAPRPTFSLWNNFRLTSRLGAGLGLVSRSDTFAAIDNTVVLPAYLRTDAAIFWNVRENLRVQVNGENLFDRRYFANADNNFNISPGNPRAIRIALIARFR
ncbi:MAG: TonB-dependent receptor [Acidobacteriia bacterium]|nr:TonB-dependent receptor [Terriglobia bacterium]